MFCFGSVLLAISCDSPPYNELYERQIGGKKRITRKTHNNLWNSHLSFFSFDQMASLMLLLHSSNCEMWTFTAGHFTISIDKRFFFVFSFHRRHFHRAIHVTLDWFDLRSSEILSFFLLQFVRFIFRLAFYYWILFGLYFEKTTRLRCSWLLFSVSINFSSPFFSRC